MRTNLVDVMHLPPLDGIDASDTIDTINPYLLTVLLSISFNKLSCSSSPRTGQSLDSESQPMLSTFGSRSSQPTPTSELLTPAGSQGLLTTKSTVVQLRRNTNKLGRQAPTTPKRTRIRLYKPYICQKKKFFV